MTNQNAWWHTETAKKRFSAMVNEVLAFDTSDRRVGRVFANGMICQMLMFFAAQAVDDATDAGEASRWTTYLKATTDRVFHVGCTQVEIMKDWLRSTHHIALRDDEHASCSPYNLASIAAYNTAYAESLTGPIPREYIVRCICYPVGGSSEWLKKSHDDPRCPLQELIDTLSAENALVIKHELLAFMHRLDGVHATEVDLVLKGVTWPQE